MTVYNEWQRERQRVREREMERDGERERERESARASEQASKRQLDSETKLCVLVLFLQMFQCAHFLHTDWV